MKKIFGTTLLAMCLGIIVHAQNYVLVYEENFDDESYKAHWFSYYPWWKARIILPSDGSPPKEQAYMSDFNNMGIIDGKLVLTVKKESISAKAYDAAGPDDELDDGLRNLRDFDYTSGIITSKLKFYEGAFEIKVKLPEVQGLWPAFWLYGQCSSEIDVFEVNTSPVKDWFNIYLPVELKNSEVLNFTIHAPQGNDEWCNCDTAVSPSCFQSNAVKVDMTDWHTIRLEWNRNRITLYIDGDPVKHISRWYDFSGRELSGWQMNAIQEPHWPNNNSMNVLFGTGVFTDNGPFNGRAPHSSFTEAQIEVEYIKLFCVNGQSSSFDYDYCNLNIEALDYVHLSNDIPPFAPNLSNRVFIGKNVSIASTGSFNLVADDNPSEFIFQGKESVEFYPGFSMDDGVDMTAQIYNSCGGNKKEDQEITTIENDYFFPSPSNGVLYHPNLAHITNVEIHDIMGQPIKFERTNELISIQSKYKGIVVINYFDQKTSKSQKILIND